jgi:putative ABC transport system permease protein
MAAAVIFPGASAWTPGSSTATARPPAGGLAVAIAVGVAAGVYPAGRAARLPPAGALRTVA